MEESSLQDLQRDLFAYTAEKISEELPMNITLTAFPNDQAIRDLEELEGKRLLCWNFRMNSVKGMTPVSNPGHIVKCVAYYGNATKGYYCVGYAIGCVNGDNTALEVNLIEKRSDASHDLRNKFLPIIVDAFTAYALYLNHLGVAQIDTFALVGPIPGLLGYYKSKGFEHLKDYHIGVDAMVKYLTLDP